MSTRGKPDRRSGPVKGTVEVLPLAYSGARPRSSAIRDTDSGDDCIQVSEGVTSPPAESRILSQHHALGFLRHIEVLAIEGDVHRITELGVANRIVVAVIDIHGDIGDAVSG